MNVLTRLSYLFGTEEAVENRRHLAFLREKVHLLLKLKKCTRGCCYFTVICSGSLGEGVIYPLPDDDIILVNERQSRRVYESYDEAFQNRAYYMRPSEHSPGFCVIYDANRGGEIVSSKREREELVQLYAHLNAVEYGPCASHPIGGHRVNYTYCLLSSVWPTMASEWVMRRRRHDCPSQELIRTIVTGGCHFAPIGNPDSPLRDDEWRLSFYLAERSLIHEFNHVQFIIYNLLKLILRKVIEISVPNVLCSYIIKTVMFFVIENTSSTLWTNERLDECFTKSLLLLYNFINNMECPNYFIPGNNMIRGKVNTINKVPLLCIVNELMNLGIFDSLCRFDMANFAALRLVTRPVGLSLEHLETKQDFDFVQVYMYLIRTPQDPFKEYINRNTGQENALLSLRKILLPIILNYPNLSNSILSLVTRRVFLQIGLKCFQISQNVKEGNKFKYQMLRQGHALLTKGCDTDISSGRLHLANYMYLTGRFRYALDIIKTVLSRYAPYVMSDESINTAQGFYMEVLCGKNYSLMDRLRLGWALNVEFSEMCVDLAPIPIRLIQNISRCTILFSPLVYAYFLQSLCLYKSGDIASMNISVKSLEDTVRGLPFISSLGTIFHGRLLLGYLKMLQQDYHTSCRYLTAAYLMKDEMSLKHNIDCLTFANSCVFLLVCLFNRVCNREF